MNLNIKNNITNFDSIEISGDDASKFLQTQITADLSLLNNDQYILSSYCNQKGRVISVFYIFKNHNNYIFLFLGDTKNIFLKKIKKYAIFSKIKFIELNHKDNIYIKKITNDDFINYLITNKIPVINSSNSEEYLPDNLNLLSHDAVSFTKGCFLGQEIIARVYYKGKNKKALYKINLNNQINKDNLLLTNNINNKNIGEILLFDNNAQSALAVLEIASINHPIFYNNIEISIQL